MEVARLTASEVEPDLLTRLSVESFFCSLGFIRLWETVGGRPVYWLAVDAGETVALLPGVEFGRWPWRRFQSMPDGVYTRALPDSPDHRARREVAGAILGAIADFGYARVYVTDFHRQLKPPAAYSPLFCSTTVLDITDEGWQPPDRKLQSELRKAEREGVTVERFNMDRHMAGFLALMRGTERRHGRSPRYPAEFFAALAALADVDDRVMWCYYEHEGAPVVSHINFVEHDLALHWQVYYDKAFSSLKANQFMLRRLIDELQARSVRRLSLGASPPEAHGLAEYKAKWGGREYGYICYHHRSGLGRLI
jgi:hypothetical protein